MNNIVYCCGQEATWVENVPGKGYNFCTKCRNEVLTPEHIEDNDKPYYDQDTYDDVWRWMSGIPNTTDPKDLDNYDAYADSLDVLITGAKDDKS